VEMQELSIENIIADDEIQIRVGVNSGRVEEFIEVYSELPAWRVVKTPDGKFILADGYHRRQAAIRKNYKKAHCKVEEGDYKRALEIAIEENCRGPLNLSRREKLNTIEKTLKYFPERANSWIGEMIGVSMQTVEKVRRTLEENKAIKTYDKLETRDGRSYPREIIDKVGVNLDKDEDERKGSPTKEEIVAGLLEVNRGRVRPEGSGFQIPEAFSGDYARQGKMPERKTQTPRIDPDSMFVEDPAFAGEVLTLSVSIDRRKAIRVIELSTSIVTIIYYIKGEKFFPESHIVMDKQDFYDYVSSLAPQRVTSELS